ncbi:MAG: ABC transporter permease [Phycisphaeraceae bacterium]|nr:ABC transporter permease [Phycisphaeraceae bacterium]
MMHVLTLALKDLRLLARDRVGFFFTCAFPLLYAIFFGAIFSGSAGDRAGISVVVADLDQTPESAAFVEELRASSALEITLAGSEEAALDHVRRGRQTGAVILPPGFGQARSNPFSGSAATLRLAVDPARSAERGLLEGVVTERLFASLAQLFGDPLAARDLARRSQAGLAHRAATDPFVGAAVLPFLQSLESFMDQAVQQDGAPDDDAHAAPAGGLRPFAIEHVDVARNRSGEPPTAFAVSFPQAISWALIGCAAAFGISLVVERTRGTLPRLLVAPIRVGHLLAGKALACFTATVAVCVFLLLVGCTVFGIRPVAPALLALAVPVAASAFVGIMMLLSVLGRTEAAAGGIGWSILLIMAMVGGGMVPQFIMPAWMQHVGAVSPVSWTIRLLDGALWRGTTASDFATQSAALLGIGLGGLLLGIIVFRRRIAAS